jgi:hypothetical protein
MTENYKEMLQKGLEYQDFITDLLLKEIGISLSTYSSKKYQYDIGENKQGIEIKFDDRYKETGNLYIEVEEKSNANNWYYVNSGIYRNDNTWLYLIGDYNEVFIFSKKQLIILHEKNIYKLVKTPTSIGFLIPKNDAEKYSIKKFEL